MDERAVLYGGFFTDDIVVGRASQEAGVFGLNWWSTASFNTGPG